MGALSASAQSVITKDMEDIGGNFRLTPGKSWTVDYTVNSPDKFLLDLSFSGTGRSGNLKAVSYGINVADQHYETFSGPATAATGTGLMDTVLVDGPFSVVYSLSSSATGAANVTYFGSLTAVNVPEIGTEGALPALLLVLGGLAVMTGVRNRDDKSPRDAA